MKKIILLACLAAGFLAPGISNAQSYNIPNGSFENWTSSTNLTNWTHVSGTIEQASGVGYTQSTVNGKDTTKQFIFRPAKDGKYCIQMTNLVSGNQFAPAVIGQHWAFTGRPQYFSANIAYFPSVQTDQAEVLIQFTKWDTATKKSVPVMTATLPTPQGTFLAPWSTVINVDLTGSYANTSTPDSATILMSSTISQSSTGGTSLFVDRVWFTDTAVTAGVDPQYANDFNASIYPNPTAATATISYNLNQSGQVSLVVYDISGKEVANLVNENQTSGSHQVTFDGAGLKNGLYIYKIQSGESVETGKIMLNR